MLATSSSDEDEAGKNKKNSKHDNFLSQHSTPQHKLQTILTKSPQNQTIKQNGSTIPNTTLISNKLSSISITNNNNFIPSSSSNNSASTTPTPSIKNQIIMTSSTNDNKSINSINSYSASSDEMNISLNTTQPNTPSSSIKYKKPKLPLVPSTPQLLHHGGSIKSNTLSIKSVSTNKSLNSNNYNNNNNNNTTQINRSPLRSRRTSSPNTSFSSKYGDEDDDDEDINSNFNENDNLDEIDRFVQRSNDTSSRNKLKQQQQQQQSQIPSPQDIALMELTLEANKEIEDHKKRLQIYVFVCRCISYPFIAKQPTDMVRRQFKITKQQLQQIKDNFEAFLNGKMQIEADEAFTNAVRSYYEVFLKSDRIFKMVGNGGCSASDFRDVFKNNIEKRVRSLPEIDGLSKETVLSSWTAKFDAIFKGNDDLNGHRRHSKHHFNSSTTTECILSKEQLYDMFQNILGIKKFEHQLIFNAAQV
jgi:hypothetical protein